MWTGGRNREREKAKVSGRGTHTYKAAAAPKRRVRVKGKGQKSTLDLKQFSEHPWTLASSGLTVCVLGARSRACLPLVGSTPQG